MRSALLGFLAVAAAKPHNVMYIVIGPSRSNRLRLYASVPLRSASPRRFR